MALATDVPGGIPGADNLPAVATSLNGSIVFVSSPQSTTCGTDTCLTFRPYEWNGSALTTMGANVETAIIDTYGTYGPFRNKTCDDARVVATCQNGVDYVLGSANYVGLYAWASNGSLVATQQWMTPVGYTCDDPINDQLSMSADGQYVAVGGDAYSSGFEGRVWILKNVGGVWSNTFMINVTLTNSLNSVSIDATGTRVVVGSEFADSGYGTVSVFVRSGETWTLETSINGPEYGYLGIGVSIDRNGTTIVACEDDGPPACLVYARTVSTWNYVTTIVPYDGDAGSKFGSHGVRFAPNGKYVMVSGKGDDGSAGAVWAFYNDPVSGWTQYNAKRVGADTPAGSFWRGLDFAVSNGPMYVVGISEATGTALWVWV